MYQKIEWSLTKIIPGVFLEAFFSSKKNSGDYFSSTFLLCELVGKNFSLNIYTV